jgi:hypothetical protein
MNITQIKKSGITALKTKKNTQAHFDGARTFLAEQFEVCQGFTLCAVPNSTDPSRVFPIGTTLTILGHHRDHRAKGYNCSYIVVQAPNGVSCDLLVADLPKYCE